MTYIAHIAFSLIWGFFCFAYDGKFNFQRNKKLFLWGFFVVCTLIMGLRGINVGVDTLSYARIYGDVCNASWTDIFSGFYFGHMEIGYAIFMKVCSVISFDSFVFFNIAEAIVYSVLTARFIYDNCDNVFVGVILFIGLNTFLAVFNIRRQMMCALLLANCWTMLLQKYYWKSVSYFVLACCSHVTGVIFILGYIAYFLRGYKKLFWIVPFVALVAWYRFETYLYWFAENFSKYNNYYANNRPWTEAHFVIVTWIIIALISLYAIYSRDNNDKLNIYGSFALAWLCCSVIGMRFNYVERVGLNFLPFVIILYEKFGYRIPWRNLRWVYYCGLVGCYLIYYYLSSLSGQYIYEFGI